MPPGDNFVAATPLTLPNREGDIEWWYESFLNIPYYEYFDYSGTGAKLAGADGKPLYSEETTSVTNRNDKWFLRLRPGKSELETIRFYVKTVDDAGVETIEPHDMELIRDQVWRGCFQTLKPIENGVQVRFEEVTRQMPGLDFYDTNRAYYKLHGDVTARALEHLPDEDTLFDLAELYKIFGDSTRIKILYILFEEELCVCDIAEALGMTVSAISPRNSALRLSISSSCSCGAAYTVTTPSPFSIRLWSRTTS